MKLVYASALALTVALSGCASNPSIDSLSSEERAQAAKIQILKGKPEQPFKILGEVSGLSCNRNAHQTQDVSESEAVEGLKIKAAILGADAVINTLCQKNSDTDWTNNCWASVKCIGDAVIFLK
jgi:RcsF lipoprotein/Domain of unknown function (DUF4156)